MKRVVLAHLLSIALVGCGSETPTDDATSGKTTEPSGHIQVSVEMTAEENGVGFLSGSAGSYYLPVQDIIGKPYFVTVFEGGFSPGNDEHLSFMSGYIQDDLKFVETTKETFPPGPYDLAVILYFKTPITEAQMSGAEALPYPKSGDVAAFTADDTRVREGDPVQVAGTIRVNITDGDTSVELANRLTPENPTPEEAARSVTDTLFIFP